MTDLRALSRVSILFDLALMLEFIPGAIGVYGPVSILFANWMLPKRYFWIYVGLEVTWFLKESIPMWTTLGTLASSFILNFSGFSGMWATFVIWPFGELLNWFSYISALYIFFKLEVFVIKWGYRDTRKLYDKIIKRIP